MSGIRWYDDGKWASDEAISLLAERQPMPGFPPLRVGVGPPATREFVAEWEAISNVTLPIEYRTFILQVADGCPGPGYGVMRLDRSELIADFGPDALDTLEPTSSLARAFLPQERRLDSSALLPDAGEWRSSDSEGTLIISDHGANVRSLLVLAGAARGEIWWDARAEGFGIYPCRACSFESDRMDASRPTPSALVHTFATWMAEYLDAISMQ
jgi:hypothetical protein